MPGSEWSGSIHSLVSSEFPSLNITRALPLNEPVVLELTPAKSGDIAFACGMNMLHGIIVVQ